MAVIVGQGISVSPVADAELSHESTSTVQNKVVTDAIASEYSTSKTYSVGDVCTHDGKLYECIVDIPTAEGWTLSHWKVSNLGDNVSNLNRQLSDVESAIIPETNARGAYVDVIQNDKIIKFASNSQIKMSDCSIQRTIAGWKLTGNGGCIEDADYSIVLYIVSTYEYLYVNIPSIGNNVPTFEFLSTDAVYSDNNHVANNVVSGMYRFPYDGYLLIPKYGRYLAVCVRNTASTNPVVKWLAISYGGQKTDNELYHPDFTFAGYVDPDTGNFVDETASGMVRTGFVEVPVDENESWTYYPDDSITWANCAYYDDEKSFIMNMTEFKNQVPVGAKYMALSGSESAMRNLLITNPVHDILDEIRNNAKKAIISGYNVYANFFNPDKIIDNHYLSRYGNVNNTTKDSDFFVVDYLRIPEHYPGVKYKYVLALSLKSGAWGANGRQIAFYDEKQNFISIWGTSAQDPDAIIEVPNNASVVRICFKKSNESRFMVTFSGNTNIPSYEEFQPKLPGQYLSGLYCAPQNSDATITNMILTGLDYAFNSEVRYGSNHTLYDDVCGGKFPPSAWQPDAYTGEAYQIDCSSFSMACLQGIRFENSRYIQGNSFNIVSANAFRLDAQAEFENYYDDGYHPGKYERIYANKMAKYAYDKGYFYYVNKDFSNVLPGDVLFPAGSNTWQGLEFFKGIGHCMLVFQKYQKKDGSYMLKIAEAISSNPNYGVIIRKLDPGIATNGFYAARFPIPDCFFPVEKISEWAGSVTTQYELSTDGQRIDVATVPLVENLQTKMVYTLAFEGTFPSNVVFEYWIGDHQGHTISAYNIGSSDDSVLMEPNGHHTVHIELPMNITINDPTKFRIAIRRVSQSGTLSGAVTISNVVLYKGYVTI